MAFDFLLWNCLVPGKTSVRESGKTVRMAREAGETVLAFEIDNEEFRKRFQVGRVCDGLFFYMAEQRTPLLFLAELKGSDFGGAVTQLEQTLGSLRKALSRYQPEFIAVIVTRRGVPKNDKKRVQQFFETNGVRLKVSRDGDLRKFI